MIPVEIKSAAESLLQRIATSTSPVFTVLTAERQLQEAGFFELPLSGDWNTPIAAALDSETMRTGGYPHPSNMLLYRSLSFFFHPAGQPI